jgi:hypothetical protein
VQENKPLSFRTIFDEFLGKNIALIRGEIEGEMKYEHIFDLLNFQETNKVSFRKDKQSTTKDTKNTSHNKNFVTFAFLVMKKRY